MAKPELLRNQYSLGSTTPPLIGMFVGITFIISGTESYFTLLTLKLVMTMGMHRTSFSGHAQSIPTNNYLHRTIGHTGHAYTLEHTHRTS